MMIALAVFAYFATAGASYVMGRYFAWWPWVKFEDERVFMSDPRHPSFLVWHSAEFRKSAWPDAPPPLADFAPVVLRVEDKNEDSVIASIFWFVFMPVSFVRRLGEAADKGRASKTKLRSELEKELAAAKAEIDSLLNPKS